MKVLKQTELDPLFTIFKKHLDQYRASNLDRQDFVQMVVEEYLLHLRKFNLIVPKPLEPAVLDELSNQVNAMLTKKTYGCLTIEEYQERANETKDNAKRRDQS